MITLHTITVPTFEKMLGNAKTWLDKASAYAEARKFDPAALLSARLAPDMFAFTRQIQVATDHVKGSLARLQQVDVPSWSDDEKTFADLHARLDKAIAYAREADAAKVNAAADREIVVKSARAERRFVSGLDFVQTYVLPNFYFHTTTAYAILRHNGVDVGKNDFLGKIGS